MCVWSDRRGPCGLGLSSLRGTVGEASPPAHVGAAAWPACAAPWVAGLLQMKYPLAPGPRGLSQPPGSQVCPRLHAWVALLPTVWHGFSYRFHGSRSTASSPLPLPRLPRLPRPRPPLSRPPLPRLPLLLPRLPLSRLSFSRVQGAFCKASHCVANPSVAGASSTSTTQFPLPFPVATPEVIYALQLLVIPAERSW